MIEVASDGAVDRARVGAIVFERPEELGWLESTLHPLVGERIAAWLAGLEPSTRLAVIEVPLLFETGMESMFEATVCVVAPDPVRVERAGARGIGELEGRSERQLTQEEKAARATYVVRNDAGLDQLDRRVDELIADLTAAREGR